MGCGGGKAKQRPPITVLSGRTDDKGRYTVPQGKIRLDLAEQHLQHLPAYAGTHAVERLDISCNELYALPASMASDGEWSKLTDLNLSHNLFARIPTAVATLPSLRILRVGGNKFLGDALAVLPSCLHLQSLHLPDCGLQVVPAALSSCPNLTEVNLSQNPNIDVGGLVLLRPLTTLELADCQLTGVPAALARCVQLTSVDLSGNPLEQLSPIEHVRTLTELKLRGMFTGERTCTPAFWRELAAVPTLRSLDLSHNPGLPVSGIENLTALTGVDLSNCSLRVVPDALSDVEQLTELVLQNNLFSTLEGLVSSNVRRSLTALNVSGNAFALPPVRADDAAWHEIGKLAALKNLVFQQWADKANSRNSNPYSTRLPWSLIAVPLEQINGIVLRTPFTKDPGSNLANLLRDSYFKVDMGIEWEVRFGYHIKLLRLFSHCRESLVFDWRASIERYKLFLHLQHRLADEKLIAPLDVAFLHYVHMTHPVAYRKDCHRMFGATIGNFYHGVDRTNPHLRSHRRYLSSVRFWEQSFSGVHWLSFDYPRDCPPDTPPWEGSLTEWPGSSAVADLRDFTFSVDFEQVSGEIFDHVEKIVSYGEFLEKHALVALARYMRFLAIEGMRYAALPVDESADENGARPFANLAATPGIQVMMHVHQCMPHKLHGDLAVLLGGRIADLNLRVDGKDDPAFDAAMTETKRLWRETWGEDFLSEGLLDDSTPSFFSPTAQGHMRVLRHRMTFADATGDSYSAVGAPRRPSLRRVSRSEAGAKGAVTFVQSTGL